MKTDDPNRDNIDPDKLVYFDVLRAGDDELDGLFDFFARYVRKVHSDDFIRKGLKLSRQESFLDVIGPNDIAYVIAVFKNSKDMWDQDIRMRESGRDAMGNPEKKMTPHLATCTTRWANGLMLSASTHCKHHRQDSFAITSYDAG